MGSYVLDGTDDHATNTVGAPVSAYPFTIGVWFRPDVATNGGCLTSIVDKDIATVGSAVEARGDVAGDPVRARSENALAVTSTGFSAAAWHSGVGVFAAGADRAAFLDGGSKGTDATSTALPAVDSISVGRHGDSSPSNFFDGRVGYVFVWGVALTDAEVLDWHNGLIPQEASVVAAYDFTADGAGTIVDQYGTLDLTVTGATFDSVESPPVTYFGGGAVALDGTSAGTSATTAQAGVQWALSGTSAGASTTTGDLRAALSLTGSSAGASTTASSLRATFQLTGTSAGTSTSAGDLAVTGPGVTALDGTSAGTSTTAGALGAVYALAATSAGTSASSATLRALWTLAGASEASSTSTGALSVSGQVQSVGLLEAAGSVRVMEGLTGAVVLEGASRLITGTE